MASTVAVGFFLLPFCYFGDGVIWMIFFMLWSSSMFTGCLGVSVSRSKASMPEILSEEIDVIDPVADTEENADIISVSSKVLCKHEDAYSVER